MKNETFTQLPTTVRKSKKLTPSQKILISYILDWQHNGLQCFESNKSIAENIGLEKTGLRSLIKTLNSVENGYKCFPFFTSTQYNAAPTAATWTSSHVLEVNEGLLYQWLLESIPTEIVKPTIKTTVKAKPIETKAIVEDIIKEDDILNQPIPKDSMFYVAPKIVVDEFDIKDHIKPAQYDIMLDSIKSLDKILKMSKVTEVTEITLDQVADHFEFPIKLGDSKLLQFINESVEDQYQIN